jgi:hypothetical protein
MSWRYSSKLMQNWEKFKIKEMKIYVAYEITYSKIILHYIKHITYFNTLS